MFTTTQQRILDILDEFSRPATLDELMKSRLGDLRRENVRNALKDLENSGDVLASPANFNVVQTFERIG